MSKPQLTKEIAYEALQNFFNQKPFVLFGTGISCAVDQDFGMGALEQYLKAEIPKRTLTKQQRMEWKSVLEALSQSSDFESAMNGIKDEILLEYVIDTTAKQVSIVDRRNTFEILNKEKSWPATSMFKRLVDRLPETDRTLHVATPNYDLLAEYAFTQAAIPYTTGFWGGVVRKLDWIQSERQMTYAEKVSTGRSKVTSITRQKKHLRLYKVHGSLNTFFYKNQVVETDAWSKLPEGVERLIITPGTSKHEKLHDYRDALLGEYDKAVRDHSAFLFLGFGFNDTQLVNNAISEKLKKNASPALIITRSSNPRIESLLKKSKNAWLVCKQHENNSTRILNSNYQGGLDLPDKELWKFDRFTTEIMGG
jgi:hypothetical protein